MVIITREVRTFILQNTITSCRPADHMYSFSFAVTPSQPIQAHGDDVGVDRDLPGAERHGNVVSSAVQRAMDAWSAGGDEDAGDDDERDDSDDERPGDSTSILLSLHTPDCFHHKHCGRRKTRRDMTHFPNYGDKEMDKAGVFFYGVCWPSPLLTLPLFEGLKVTETVLHDRDDDEEDEAEFSSHLVGMQDRQTAKSGKKKVPATLQQSVSWFYFFFCLDMEVARLKCVWLKT